MSPRGAITIAELIIRLAVDQYQSIDERERVMQQNTPIFLVDGDTQS
jgi:hypothetical protein